MKSIEYELLLKLGKAYKAKDEAYHIYDKLLDQPPLGFDDEGIRIPTEEEQQAYVNFNAAFNYFFQVKKRNTHSCYENS